jgi:hypothetical protein
MIVPINSTPRAEPDGALPVEPASSSHRPFLRFYHSAALRTKTLAILTTLEQAPDPTRHRNALSDLVMELTDSGLEYYFLGPLDQAQAGFVVKQSAHAGIGTIKRVMGPVVHNVIGRLDADQLRTVCRHIRQLME